MAQELRCIKPGIVYEVVRRTFRGRFAFVPTPELVCALYAILAVAQKRWPQVDVHICTWLSNHLHALLSTRPPYSANILSEWLNYVMGESAKIAGVIHGLDGPIWELKRCRLIPILDDEMLRARTKYIMAQATAAGLVAKPEQWLGVNTCKAVCEGVELGGHLSTAALRRQAVREGVSLAKLSQKQVFELSPLPAQIGWSVPRRQAWFRKIRQEIITETAAANPGKRYPPPEFYTRLDPTAEKALEESPAPKCWVSPGNQEARRAWKQAIRRFTDAWREALKAWVDGAKACFPAEGWVPFKACFAKGYPRLE